MGEASVTVQDSVRITNGEGKGTYVLTCDHASNFMPPEFAGLGLSPDQFERHIAWDPGALGVAQAMAAALDAPLIETGIYALCWTATVRLMRQT